MREFYINDAGNQIRKLGESIYARYRQIEQPDYPFPEDGYHGEYIKEIAKDIYYHEREKVLTFLDEDHVIFPGGFYTVLPSEVIAFVNNE